MIFKQPTTFYMLYSNVSPGYMVLSLYLSYLFMFLFLVWLYFILNKYACVVCVCVFVCHHCLPCQGTMYGVLLNPPVLYGCQYNSV